MTLTRIAHPGLLAGLFLLAVGGATTAVGCKKPSARSKPSGATDSEPATLAVPGAVTPPQAATGTPTSPISDARTAQAFAGQFLRAVNDGTATAAMLTPQFKKIIAEPVFESDRALGYSDAGAASWLSSLKGQLPGPVIGPGIGADPKAQGFVGWNLDGNPTSWYVIRIVPAGNGWQADWLSVLPASVLYDAREKDGLAGIAGAAFLQAMIGKDDRLASGLMSPALKARLAPPFDSDKTRGFNRGILSGKLADLRGGATEARVTSATGNTVTATLIAGGSSRSVALKFVEGERPWDWLVDDIEVK
jgi:hypothetical protein